MVIKVSRNKEFYYWLIAVSIMASFSILFVHVSSAIIQGHIILNISSNPTGADVYIDNIYYGKTPVVVTIVNPKTYSIVLELEGYDRWERQYNPNDPNIDPEKIDANLTKSGETTTTLTKEALSPTEKEPGFLGISSLIIFLCGYLILRKK